MEGEKKKVQIKIGRGSKTVRSIVGMKGQKKGGGREAFKRVTSRKGGNGRKKLAGEGFEGGEEERGGAVPRGEVYCTR